MTGRTSDSDNVSSSFVASDERKFRGSGPISLVSVEIGVANSGVRELRGRENSIVQNSLRRSESEILRTHLDERFSRLELRLLNDGVVVSNKEGSVVLFKDLSAQHQSRLQLEGMRRTYDGLLDFWDGHFG